MARLITNAMLCSAARVAMLEKRLAADALRAIVCWRDREFVCAIGAELTRHEVNCLLGMGIEGPDSLTAPAAATADIVFEDIVFAQLLAMAHDDWANAAECGSKSSKAVRKARAAFLTLLAEHDPVAKLARDAERATAPAPELAWNWTDAQKTAVAELDAILGAPAASETEGIP